MAAMILVAIAWVYVVVMMAAAEAMSPAGGVLGAVFTLLLYGVLPLSVLLYIMNTPARRRARRARESAEEAAEGPAEPADARPAVEPVPVVPTKTPVGCFCGAVFPACGE